MGFYGNISNVGRTNMVFDRIYSSRKAMDANAAKDGVYAGRYVLVEYDQDNKKDTHIQFYLKGSSFNADGSINISNSTICYSDRECSKVLSIKARESYFFKNNKIEYVASGSKDDPSGKITSLTGKDLIDSYLLFTVEGADINARRERYEEVKHILYYQKDSSTFVSCQNEDYSSSRTYYTKKSGYQTNYLTDFDTYTETYDSTVWMKQYDNNGIPKYINIASLNTVTPTFDIRAEAPSDNPKAPDFDEDRTNLHYDLHITTPWGFKIKETDLQVTSYDKDYANNYQDNKVSDSGTQKIFFNKEAFASQLGKKKSELHKKVTLNENDNISIINTSNSNNKYWVKENGAWIQKGNQNDTKELSIVLPAIGNMMSDAWDIIYGPKRDSSRTQSLQGRLDAFSEMEALSIPVNNNDGELVGAFLNDNNKDIRLNQLQAQEELELAVLESEKEINGWTEEEYLSHKLTIEEKYLNEKGKITDLISDDSWIETSVQPGDNEKAPSIQIHHKKKLQDAVQTSWPPDFWGNEIKFGEEIAWNVYTIDMAGHINQVIPMTMHLPSSGIITLDADPTENMHAVTKQYFDTRYTNLSQDVGTKVPMTRKINGLSLSSDINLNASLVGAVPTTRTVNGKSLASNISLTASDIGALPTNAPVIQYDTAQTLTDSQKEQVKNNLGLVDSSKLITIIGDKDGNINYTYHQILDFYQNNESLIFIYQETESSTSKTIYQLVEATSPFKFQHLNQFQGQTITESYVYISLGENESTVVEYKTNTLNVSEGEGGEGALIVTPLSVDSSNVNYSASEIYTYLQNGKNIIFRQYFDNSASDFIFDRYDGEKIIFVAPGGVQLLGPNHLALSMIYVNEDKTYKQKMRYLYVDEGRVEIDPPDEA